MTAAVRAMAARHPGAPLYAIGHSMGAAMATIAALDLKFKANLSDVRLVTFGSPRVGNDVFARFTQSQTTVCGMRLLLRRTLSRICSRLSLCQACADRHQLDVHQVSIAGFHCGSVHMSCGIQWACHETCPRIKSNSLDLLRPTGASLQCLLGGPSASARARQTSAHCACVKSNSLDLLKPTDASLQCLVGGPSASARARQTSAHCACTLRAWADQRARGADERAFHAQPRHRAGVAAHVGGLPPRGHRGLAGRLWPRLGAAAARCVLMRSAGLGGAPPVGSPVPIQLAHVLGASVWFFGSPVSSNLHTVGVPCQSVIECRECAPQVVAAVTSEERDVERAGAGRVRRQRRGPALPQQRLLPGPVHVGLGPPAVPGRADVQRPPGALLK
jgi:hypothetical protein